MSSRSCDQFELSSEEGWEVLIVELHLVLSSSASTGALALVHLLAAASGWFAVRIERALFLFKKDGAIRKPFIKMAQSMAFEYFILTLIVFCCTTLAVASQAASAQHQGVAASPVSLPSGRPAAVKGRTEEWSIHQMSRLGTWVTGAQGHRS